jgi:hypothetical protein
MNRAIRSSLALALLGSLAACGETRTDRAISGAGVGAAAGGLTSDRDINLGKPVWQW